MVKPKKRIKRAVKLLTRFGGIDGEHHKRWVIDQVVRKLLGADAYWVWRVDQEAGEDGPKTYPWCEGIAP